MQWSQVSKVRNSDLPLYQYDIRDLAGAQPESRAHYSIIWRLIMRDILPVAVNHPWRFIEASYRMEDGGSGILFKNSKQEYIDAIPPVRIFNGHLSEEVDILGLALDMGEIGESEMQTSWDEIVSAYSKIILKSALDAGLPEAVDDSHRPFTFQILCYDTLVLEHEIT